VKRDAKIEKIINDTTIVDSLKYTKIKDLYHIKE